MAEGRRIRKALMTRFPALRYLTEAVKKTTKEKGWMRLPDGRRVYVRSEHAALNSLLQGAGAIICKAWIVEFNRRLMERFGTPAGGGWDHEWAALGWIHDEVQIAVRSPYVEEVAQILKDSMVTVTNTLAWRIPLEAEAQVGDTWADTH